MGNQRKLEHHTCYVQHLEPNLARDKEAFINQERAALARDIRYCTICEEVKVQEHLNQFRVTKKKDLQSLCKSHLIPEEYHAWIK